MEDIIKLHDKKFRIMIPAAKIDEAVAAVACRILSLIHISEPTRP